MSLSQSDVENNQRRTCFERHVQQSRKRIYKLAYRLLGNTADAEDITQEAFSRAWASYPSFDTSRSFDAWLHRITTNLIVDQCRRKQRRRTFSLDTLTEEGDYDIRELADRSSDPSVCLLAQQVNESLSLALHALPQGHQEMMLLLGQGQSYEQIARRMQCPMGTVRSRVHRARQRIRAELASLCVQEATR